MTMKLQLSRGTIFARFVFVVLCCVSSAKFAADLSQYTTVQTATTIAFLTIGLFGTLLCVTGWLGASGKESESWAVLAYGSWMTIPGLALLNTTFFYRQMVLTDWIVLSIPACIFAFFAWVGLRAALQDKWTEVFLWWVASVPPVFIFLSLLGKASGIIP